MKDSVGYEYKIVGYCDRTQKPFFCTNRLVAQNERGADLRHV